MLIYKLLGDQAQSEFARSWGISYGMNAATEWKDIAIEAVRATIVLIILERLFLTRNSAWLEEHADYLSIVRARRARRRCPRLRADAPALCAARPQQALLFKRASLSTYQQVRLFFRYTKRLS